MKYISLCSGGNDSIALMQLMYSKRLDFAVLYNDTGWARSDWPDRMEKIKKWCDDRGIEYIETKSIGMEALVKRNKGWPMPASRMQFCTGELKERPTLDYLEKIDPSRDLVIATGRRREESQNRANLPVHQPESKKHGGRDVWNPLASFNESERNTLILDAGFAVLPHSSMECYPCVCANKKDLAAMQHDSKRIAEIEAIELSLGMTKKGHPRVMFRPYRVGGGVGIQQAVDWGAGPRGYKSKEIPVKYLRSDVTEQQNDDLYDDATEIGKEMKRQCDGGFCGS